MENELKFKHIDPEESLHDGIQHMQWDSKEQMLNKFPYQPERSKREDVNLGELIEKVVFARNQAEVHGELIQIDLLNDILHYFTMRYSELMTKA